MGAHQQSVAPPGCAVSHLLLPSLLLLPLPAALGLLQNACAYMYHRLCIGVIAVHSRGPLSACAAACGGGGSAAACAAGADHEGLIAVIARSTPLYHRLSVTETATPETCLSFKYAPVGLHIGKLECDTVSVR